jgi:hypothetical protein
VWSAVEYLHRAVFQALAYFSLDFLLHFTASGGFIRIAYTALHGVFVFHGLASWVKSALGGVSG